MGRITKKAFWDKLYDEYKELIDNRNFKKYTFRNLIEFLLSEELLKCTKSYADIFLWEEIYKKFLPKGKQLKVLEVGSAPGHFLVKLHKKFGYEPYGVEYSKKGVEINRKIFKFNNINPKNVIYADFLSNEFQNKYREKFDMIISRGFIEHFTDTTNIIKKHKNLLKKEGIISISVPNFRSLNYILLKFFYRELIREHNFNIMQRENFLRLFKTSDFLKLFCNYYGVFNFSIFYAKKNSFKRYILNICKKIQILLNVVFHFLLKNRRLDSKLFSPYIIFVGVKKV